MEKKTTKEIVDLFKDIHPYNWGMNKKAYDDFNNYKNTEWVRVEDVIKKLKYLESIDDEDMSMRLKYDYLIRNINAINNELSQSSEEQVDDLTPSLIKKEVTPKSSNSKPDKFPKWCDSCGSEHEED